MFSFPDSSQLWKLDGNTLKSKANIWTSDKWHFKTKDDFILIRNFSKKKVLESTSDGKVSQENLDANGELVKKQRKKLTRHIVLKRIWMKKFQFNFPAWIGPCPMLKKLKKKSLDLGDNPIYPIWKSHGWA